MLDKVKTALRISHNVLDSDIEGTIEIARADMIRSGVTSDIANDDTKPLVESCIKTYCLFFYADKDNSERYWKSYQYQLDNLRKSSAV